jgi:ABC-2 type transport system ATP-binding protein
MKEGKVIATGTTEELVQMVQGKVWNCAVPAEKLPFYEQHLSIVNLKNEDSGTVSVRYLADQPQTPDSRSIKPRLEDLYLWLFPPENKEGVR